MKATEQNNGSVSHGTMLNEDLIPCFIDELTERMESSTFEAGADSPERVKRMGELEASIGEIERRMIGDDDELIPLYFESEEAGWDLEWLFDVLDEFAPDGCYFGAHPGDGCDYGFWACESDEADED